MGKKTTAPTGALLCENAEYVAFLDGTEIAIHASTPEGPGDEVAKMDVLDATQQESLANFMQHAIREVRRRREGASDTDAAEGTE